jgi:protein gp37
MAITTEIEWADCTLNIVTGCTKVSEGCRHCYIERTPPFRMAGRRFEHPGIGGTPGVQLHPERLALPRHWMYPRRIFVNSLADLFHREVPTWLIARLWATAALTPQHQYLILTKRPGRMGPLLRSPRFLASYQSSWQAEAGNRRITAPPAYPLPNVVLGVSVENAQALHRIDALRATPAAARFLSCEPLLGPLPGLDLTWIDRVIAGGESGPGARPMHPDWVRAIRDRCVTAGVPFLFKQWGEWLPQTDCDAGTKVRQTVHLAADPGRPGTVEDTVMARVGKKPAGRLLDGELWDQFLVAAYLSMPANAKAARCDR